MLKKFSIKIFIFQIFLVVTLLSGCTLNLNNQEVPQEEVKVSEISVEIFRDGQLIPFGEGNVTFSIEEENIKFNVSGEGLNPEGTYSLDFNNSNQSNVTIVPNVILTKGKELKEQTYTLKPNSKGELPISIIKNDYAQSR